MSLAPPSPIAITYGDPAGIGPDLVLTLPDAFADAPLVVIGDRQVLTERAQQLGLTVPLGDWQPGQPLPGGWLPVWHTAAGASVTAGQPIPATATGDDNGSKVNQMLNGFPIKNVLWFW